MNDGGHQHEWYPLAYYEPEAGSTEQPAVAVWACSGSTDKGRCIATSTGEAVQSNERKRHIYEQEAEYEREQRHWNWEER